MFFLQVTGPNVSIVLFLGTLGMLVLVIGLILFIIFHQRKVIRYQQKLQSMEIEQQKAIELRRLASTFLIADGEVDKASRLPEVFDDEKSYAAVFGKFRLTADSHPQRGHEEEGDGRQFQKQWRVVAARTLPGQGP